MHQDLRIAPRPEAVAAMCQLIHQRDEVVDLAVECDPHRLIFVRKRLVAARQVDDAETAVAKPDVLVMPAPRVVGTAMRDDVAHADQTLEVDLLTVVCQDEAADSAHDGKSVSSRACR